jgi:hypothetical protein
MLSELVQLLTAVDAEHVLATKVESFNARIFSTLLASVNPKITKAGSF